MRLFVDADQDVNRGVLLLFAQLIGSIAAAGVVKGLLPGHPELLFKVTLTQGMTVAQGLFLEMFLTAELVFTICMLAAEVCVKTLHYARAEGAKLMACRNTRLPLLPQLASDFLFSLPN